MGATLGFFQWIGKAPVYRHGVKIICKGLQIALSLNLSIQILILSWPWAMLGSDFRITFKMSFSEKIMVLEHVFVCAINWGGIQLLFFKREHFLAKLELKISLFTWKLVTNISSIGGMQGILLPLKKHLRIDK